jgi:hypothetical protein
MNKQAGRIKQAIRARLKGIAKGDSHRIHAEIVTRNQITPWLFEIGGRPDLGLIDARGAANIIQWSALADWYGEDASAAR